MSKPNHKDVAERMAAGIFLQRPIPPDPDAILDYINCVNDVARKLIDRKNADAKIQLKGDKP